MKRVQGHAAQHLNTLAGFVTQTIQSRSWQLSKIVAKTPDETKGESRVRRHTRFLKHKEIDNNTYYLNILKPY
jgi:hypothetical protein